MPSIQSETTKQDKDNRSRRTEKPSVTYRPVRAARPRSNLPTIATVVGIVAILYLGQEVFLPLAIAFLFTFALAPVVSSLRRHGIPKVPAVALTVTSAFAFIALFSFLVAAQVNTLAQNIPAYQTNILEKIRSLKDVGASGGIIDRLSGAVEQVGAELEREDKSKPGAPTKREPLPVEIVSRDNPVEALRSVIGPLLSPFATAGLILVVVVFMLLEREDLRDRFIRLVGYNDLHRTTQALQDAGDRVGRYLLTQLVVNTAYAVPIAIGLWWLGIPNALLWGLLTLVLRFVPYIGPAIGMLLPLFLAVAVAPGWSLVIWTGLLFIVMELVSNNILEPWLYGSRTGLSSLAIIVSAIFWTWLWGPLGLVLSTPLTVCLVVLGRHVPQFAFLDVMLGNEPVLEPHVRLYQRLLAGDPDEATDHAETFLEQEYLVYFYDKVAIPALLLAEQDRHRGVLSSEERAQLAITASTLVSNLDVMAAEEAAEEEQGTIDESAAALAIAGEDLPDGSGHNLLCTGGRGAIDDAASKMLAQVLESQGAQVAKARHDDLEIAGIEQLPLDGVDTVVVTFLNSNSISHARHVIRRLKRIKPKLRVGIFAPRDASESFLDPDTVTRTAGAINADFIASSMMETARLALADTPAVPLSALPTRVMRRRLPSSTASPAR
jgi:predicted PurR-regulated permease PerM